jgi:hypothetical protein
LFSQFVFAGHFISLQNINIFLHEFYDYLNSCTLEKYYILFYIFIVFWSI